MGVVMKARTLFIAMVAGCMTTGCSSGTSDTSGEQNCGDATSGGDTASAIDTTPGPDTTTETGAPTDTSPGIDTTPDVPSDGSTCPILTGGTLCTKVPSFTGTQVVDGFGDEFCAIPATKLAVRDGVVPPTWGAPGSLVSSTVHARVAWSPLGIHAHFHVDDGAIITVPGGGLDSVILYVGGDIARSGLFDAATHDPGFMEIVLAPEGGPVGWPGFTGDMPATTAGLFCRPDSSTTHCAPESMGQLVAPVQTATRRVPSGYEYELYVPWGTLGRAAPPSSGDSIAIDLGYFACDDPSAVGKRDFACGSGYGGESWIGFTPLPTGTSSTCESVVIPDCDDRTWCTATLE
jgi:hypothetical protein